MKRSKLLFSIFKLPLDYLLIVLSFILAFYTRTRFDYDYIWAFNDYLIFALSIAPLWVLIFALLKLYSPQEKLQGPEEFGRIVIGNFAATLLAMSWIFISRTDFFSRLVIFYALGYSIVLIGLFHILINILRHYLYQWGIGVIRVAIIGDHGIGKKIIQNFQQEQGLGFRITKIFNQQVVDKLTRVLASNIDEVIIAEPKLSERQISQVLEYCQEKGIGFKVVPNLFRVQTTRLDISIIAGIPIIEYLRTPLYGWGAVIKRIFDIIGSLILMIILSPLLALATLGIKITSPNGPILFRQERVGLGRNFIFLKFRTMVPDAHKLHQQMIKKYGNMFKLKDDPRITRFGKFLRQTSIDELPQLWNVLKGEMSLIGPRPPMPEEVKLYNAWHRKRLGIRPGITGLWQVSGRSDLDFDEWVRLDVYYIENWSLWLDLMIFFKTIWVVLRGCGAY